VHWAIMSFFSTPLSQSLTSIVSLAWENVVGRVRRNSTKWTGVVVEVEVLVAGELVGWAAYC
jgi:hypothetical protein